MTLPRNIALRIREDVFSRPEVDGRVFVQRPAGREGHLARLIRKPASDWWSKIEEGTQLDRLIAEYGSNGSDSYTVESFVASLVRDGFVPVEDQQVIEAAQAYPATVDVFEDPWKYQFSRPSLGSPWFVLWEVTDKCSQQCSFCYNPERENEQVGLGQAEKVVTELVRNRVPYVTLLGGEPLSNVHIEEIIRMLSSNRIYTKIITSGVPLTAAKVQRLKAAGLHQIALSLDALTADLNDLTRGPNSFHHFMRARKLLGREIPCVSLSLTVSTATLDQLDDLPEFCREWDLDDVYFSQLRAVEGIVYPPQVRPLNYEQIGQMNAKAEELNEHGVKAIVVKQCSCGRSSAVIQADGTMRPCPFSTARPGQSNGDISRSWANISRKAEALGPLTANSGCFRRFSEDQDQTN